MIWFLQRWYFFRKKKVKPLLLFFLFFFLLLDLMLTEGVFKAFISRGVVMVYCFTLHRSGCKRPFDTSLYNSEEDSTFYVEFAVILSEPI